ncbi:succinate dehydrogenase (ubiquinone) cytochrome b560 subunit [Blastomyces dermatitidis ATCC 26199]|nr:succinate dehydrogenase (ubiquinone) cytochrome b560 subunit [Blastomyces dermatitidis ATCC 26199]
MTSILNSAKSEPIFFNSGYIPLFEQNYAAVAATIETASSTKASEDPNDLLRKQRLNRPISPNLTIYRPQVTSVLSILHRNTGLLVSGGFYLFFAVYLASPWLGWHIDSASMAASFGALPVAAKVLLRTTVALPFTFHSFNGVRHLIWVAMNNLDSTPTIGPEILPCAILENQFSTMEDLQLRVGSEHFLQLTRESMAASGVRAMEQDRRF